MSTLILQRPRLQAAIATRRSVWHHLWQGLEAHGQRRAAAELRRTAIRLQHTDPSLAAELWDSALHAERT